MAALSASCLVGPVPFKDVATAVDGHSSTPEEYEDIVSGLPSSTALGMVLRQYRGSWVIQERVTAFISLQRRFTPRPGDVLLASPAKCGTTWLKALAFATMARGAYPPTDAQHPLLRMNPHECVPFMDELFTAGQDARLEALPSPRLMHTHMHHSLLPASVTDNPDCKIVFICRDPKDMLVSLWHFVKGVRPFTFDDLFNSACEGKTPNGPIWDHLIGYWSTSKTSPDNVLFLRYEEMLIDPVGHVRELARFIGQPFSHADEAAGIPADIVKLCSFDKLKGQGANTAGSYDGKVFSFAHETFFRKGVAGDWVNNMTPEMAQRFDTIIEDTLRGSGLTFK
ncbi:unnamed protein product [Triticum turgidum subsp. durum]|uniref:Sulfotransferase n=2 Tax=Triticum turgidum subsp. durum TaxID=4567 RepID=A0A9R1REC2_TRITD|nr:unnamed protein product [Triticum turgidum subsp. durum]